MTVTRLNGIVGGLLLVVLSGCSLFQPDISHSGWPEGIPPRSEFEALYAADKYNQEEQSEDEYLTWVNRFYQGWQLYPEGWSDLIPEVLEEVEDPEERAELEAELYDAGRFIASEWSKDADTRKVRTRQLSIWGNAMREAVARDEIREMVEQIVRDVDRLKSQHLSYSDITSSRYYAEDENDVFR